jgi:hypothetical protein
MDYLRRLAPTPDTLRNGRLTLVVFGVFLAVLVALIVFVPEFADANLRAIVAATGLAVVGDCIAYLGQPSLTRYRIGLVVTAIGVLASFLILVTNPF